MQLAWTPQIIRPVGEKHMRVLISGSSGLVGTAITRLLIENGHAVSRLLRHKSQDKIIEAPPTAPPVNEPSVEAAPADAPPVDTPPIEAPPAQASSVEKQIEEILDAPVVEVPVEELVKEPVEMATEAPVEIEIPAPVPNDV